MIATNRAHQNSSHRNVTTDTSLEGLRVYLRILKPSDVGENYLNWMNDPEVTKFLMARFHENCYTTKELRGYIRSISQDPNIRFFGVFDKENHAHIGNVKLGPIDFSNLMSMIGIVIGQKQYWNKGYATEAIRVVVQYAFQELKLHKLMAGCLEQNKGSMRAFQKIGFVQEGLFRKHERLESRYVDAILFALLAENFQ